MLLSLVRGGLAAALMFLPVVVAAESTLKKSYSDNELDADDMNTWNRTRRLARAYIDDENDPVLEADLLASAGYTEEQFLEWVEVFSFSAREFQQFLVKSDKSQ